MSYQQQAYKRIVELFDVLPGHERPADIIADLIHYCNEDQHYDFEEELRVAREYADDEQQEDAESARDRDNE